MPSQHHKRPQDAIMSRSIRHSSCVNGSFKLALERLLLPERRVDAHQVDALVVERFQERQIVADEDRAVQLVRVGRRGRVDLLERLLYAVSLGSCLSDVCRSCATCSLACLPFNRLQMSERHRHVPVSQILFNRARGLSVWTRWWVSANTASMWFVSRFLTPTAAVDSTFTRQRRR